MGEGHPSTRSFVMGPPSDLALAAANVDKRSVIENLKVHGTILQKAIINI